MIIKKLVKMNISLTCHPLGLKKQLEEQIKYVKSLPKIKSNAKNVLIIGSSGGYGLATRITAAFGWGANTIGVSFHREPSERKPLGSSEYWNQQWFSENAKNENLISININGDAFSDEMKTNVINIINEKFNGKLDMLVYAVASGKRKDPETGILHSSTLKSIGKVFTGETLDIATKALTTVSIDPANDEEIANTVKVMGGEDWERWISFLSNANVLSDSFKTFSYTYIGSKTTENIYKNGTIGMAKKDLIKKASSIRKMKNVSEASVISAKAIVTKASAFIPSMPLYSAGLIKTMIDNNNDEKQIQHIYRTYNEMIFGDKKEMDDNGIYRPDSWELSDKIQSETEKLLSQVNESNFWDLLNVNEFVKRFDNISGFDIDGINYDEDIDVWPLVNQTELST